MTSFYFIFLCFIFHNVYGPHTHAQCRFFMEDSQLRMDFLHIFIGYVIVLVVLFIAGSSLLTHYPHTGSVALNPHEDLKSSSTWGLTPKEHWRFGEDGRMFHILIVVVITLLFACKELIIKRMILLYTLSLKRKKKECPRLFMSISDSSMRHWASILFAILSFTFFFISDP